MVEQLKEQLLFVGLGMLIYATIVFLISIVKKRNDIADVAWGMAYCFIILLLLLNGAVWHPVGVMTYSLVIFWGIRLSLYIFLRNRNKSEDFRYKKWREEWGHTFYWRSYLQVYLLQAIFALVISAPIILVGSTLTSEIHWLSVVGVAVWVLGFYFQTVGDQQLRVFKSTNQDKEKVITSGLWKYSRHPNYFGEVTMWWGIFIVVLPLNFGFWTIISPVVITYLIRYVSGVPMLEKRYENNRQYQEYKKRVPALFPKFW